MSEDSKRSPGPAWEPLENKGERGGRSVAWVALVAAGAAVAVLGGGGIIVALNAPEAAPSNAPAMPSAPEPHGPPEPAPAAVAEREAEDLRKLAKLDCDAEKWGECVAKLDRAADLDPEGNLARGVKRMRKEAQRAQLAEQADLDPPTAPRRPRSLDAEQRAALTAALRGDGGGAGVHVHLACAPAQEPARFCDQLTAAMKKAGWVVTRAKAGATDAGGLGATLRLRGQRIDVSTDADEGTQAQADTLADLLERDGIIATGPQDAAPGSQLPSLRVTVGPQ